VLGEKGLMKDCTIRGGQITIHGRFVEGDKPGLVKPDRLVVTSAGVVVSKIVQPEQPTAFAFEKGCKLRVEITGASTKPA